ncbi:hypothetical protein [Bacteriovorax sp. Seq25_V]|uniref:hypothetical protein n=1 Tax=Bacteriovorax sp. Seq25_V TaxID=1201288 RepID=UPI000389DAA8|nr:hypothetical protein [Bacteriovorax sp. Seq25_V]EQC43815.1 hypothetical protein M900_1229 [Bacteriovorax sp. Seq25_V]
MKAILFSFLCLSTLASTGINVKVSDGLTAQCKTKADIQRYKFGAYKTSLNSVSVSNETADFNVNVKFLTCQSEGEEIGFSEIAPLSTLSYKVVTMDREVREVIAQPEEVKVIAYRDGVFKKIAEVVLANDSTQDLDLDIKIEDLLSLEEISSLNEGKVITGNFDYQVQKLVRINDSKYANTINFGAFRIHFKASLDASNSIKIETLK